MGKVRPATPAGATPAKRPSAGKPATLALAIVAFLVPLLHAPVPAAGQPDPGTVIGPILDRLPPTVIPPAENETGEDLHSEDIRIHLLLDVVNVDYQVLGIVFGGGKVGADIEATLHLEFRAVSLRRLDEAMRAATGEHNVSVSRTFGIPADRLALTAEEVRAAGAGELLAAFEAYEASQARQYLQEALPGLVVLSLDLDWSNTIPLHTLRSARPDPLAPPSLQDLEPVRVVPLREPPIVLDGKANLRYLQRTDLVTVLEGVAREPTPEEERLQDLKRSVQENETGLAADRTAFQLLGFGQLLDFDVPPGWRVDLEMRVPQGFTIEGASGSLVVADDHRGLLYRLDGDGRSRTATETNLVTLSNRALVTTAALAVVLLLGYAVRFPLEAGTLWGVYALHRRRGEDVVRPNLMPRPRWWGRFRAGRGGKGRP